MIQDIAPNVLNNEFKNHLIRPEDIALFFDKEGKLLVHEDNRRLSFPKGSETEGLETIYLFSIDDTRYFLVTDKDDYIKDGFVYRSVRDLRKACTGPDIYAVFTAYHLWKWYSDNHFCGRCSKKLCFDKKERALRCVECGNVIYPRINPAVIVGVTKGDHILITRYREGFRGNALVAGFTEIGETLEETVAREVMEEAGIKVKNIRYCKSQPWGMAQDILAGFYCDAEDDAEIHMDENELRYAEWVHRNDIVLQEDNLSLTNEMMKAFKENRENS